MKKLLFSGYLMVCLIVLTTGFTHKTEWFLSGTNTIITSSTTVSYGDTNVPYTLHPGLSTYLLPSGTSNAVIVDQGFPQVLSLTQTNIYKYFFQNGTNATNVTVVNTNSPVAGIAWNDVRIWPDGQGDTAPLNLVALFNITNAAQSNTITMVFAPVDAEMAATRSNLFTVAFNIGPLSTNGPYVYNTNFPSAFLNGNGGIRLQSVNVSVSSQTNIILGNVGVAGWAP